MEQRNSSSSEFNKTGQGKNTALRKIFIYIFCGAVAVVYGYIFLIGRRPDVSREYRMYFMEHTLSDWPGEGRFVYSPGTKEYCLAYDKYDLSYPTLCLRKGKGWKNVSKTGSQFDGEEAGIYYPFEDGLENGGKLKMSLNGFTGKKEVDIYVKYSRDDLPKMQDARDVFDESGQVEEKIGSIRADGEYVFEVPPVKKGDLAHIIFKGKGPEKDRSAFNLYWIEIDSK